jgi:hypothetical protein
MEKTSLYLDRKGTRDAVVMLTEISERSLDMDEEL